MTSDKIAPASRYFLGLNRAWCKRERDSVASSMASENSRRWACAATAAAPFYGDVIGLQVWYIDTGIRCTYIPRGNLPFAQGHLAARHHSDERLPSPRVSAFEDTSRVVRGQCHINRVRSDSLRSRVSHLHADANRSDHEIREGSISCRPNCSAHFFSGRVT